MASNNDPTVSSPIASTNNKVQNGRIEKSRARKPESKTPNYSINGRTYACQSCKKGHRVSKCTHAATRPVHMTNDPGRPSSDQQRHCDCPRDCHCTKKNCKCPRTCFCTQSMYMLVHIPFGKQADPSMPGSGEWKVGEEVKTDLDGKILSDEQVEERKRIKEEIQRGSPNGIKLERSDSASFATTQPLGTPGIESDAPSQPISTKSCCGHRKAIDETTSARPNIQINHLPVRARPRCNCGPDCVCAFCLEHPNNMTSQRIAREQATHFAEQGFSGGLAPWQPYGSSQPFTNISCMGTNPSFAMHSSPNPSTAELQGLFGLGAVAEDGYYLQYPIIGGTWGPASITPKSEGELIPPLLFPSVSDDTTSHNSTPSIPVPDTDQQILNYPTTTEHVSLLNGQLDAPFSFHPQPSPMEVGDASISLFNPTGHALEGQPLDQDQIWADSEQWISEFMNGPSVQDGPSVNQSFPSSNSRSVHGSTPQLNELQDLHFNDDLPLSSLPTPQSSTQLFPETRMHPNLPPSSQSCCQQQADTGITNDYEGYQEFLFPNTVPF